MGGLPRAPATPPGICVDLPQRALNNQRDWQSYAGRKASERSLSQTSSKRSMARVWSSRTWLSREDTGNRELSESEKKLVKKCNTSFFLYLIKILYLKMYVYIYIYIYIYIYRERERERERENFYMHCMFFFFTISNPSLNHIQKIIW